MKTKKKKRPSGSAQIRSQGKAAVLLRLTPEQLELIDAACVAEGRSRANYIVHHAAEAARKLAAIRLSDGLDFGQSLEAGVIGHGPLKSL